jgi:thiol-disulfide isomerase/thioredoxin
MKVPVMRSFVPSVVLLILMCNAKSQNIKSLGRPEIGRQFINFVLDSVDNYSKKNISYTEFKNKWIILDLWGEYCGGCIESFPKINKLQKKFQKDIQFILVTETYKDPRTSMSLFKKLRDKFELSIPVSYDQNFVKRIGPGGLPTMIIINPNGVVVAITYTISESDINGLLNGKTPVFPRTYLLGEQKPSDGYDNNIPWLLNNNGGKEADYIYRSVITKWNPSMPSEYTIVKRNRLEAIKMDLVNLYRLAYIGVSFWGERDTAFYNKYYYPLILEIKDSTFFTPDFKTGKNIFCYSLSFATDIITGNAFNPYRIADKPRFKKIMQTDLENCFGFRGFIEMRRVPVYKLVASDVARKKLITVGGRQVFEQPNGGKGFIGKNITVQELIGKIRGSAEYPYYKMGIIDETGIAGNIDISIDAVYFDDWLKELRKLGLDLITDEKDMKVLVIRDSEKDE